MHRAAFKAAALVSVVAVAGLVLLLASSDRSTAQSLGQALLSGAVLGGVFVFIESSLTQAAERRSAHESLITQITLSSSLVGVDLAGRTLRDLYLPSKQMTAARLAGVDLAGTVLLHGDFRHADLERAVLDGADFGGATLQHATLTQSSARGASFLDADLSHALLGAADLREADLSYAVLRKSELRAADLRGARLACADLTGCDLTDARLEGAVLDEVHFDDNTKWPAGSAPAQTGPPPPAYTPGTTLNDWLIRRAELQGRDGSARQRRASPPAGPTRPSSRRRP